MSRMSKLLINKLSFFLLCLILSFHSISQSSETKGNTHIQNWIENIPILSSLISNKRDVVEFDSSNGKIISISFDAQNLSKKKILLFYKNFFKQKNWEKVKNKHVWRTRSKTFKTKIFKIEGINKNIFTIKIIIENF